MRFGEQRAECKHQRRQHENRHREREDQRFRASADVPRQTGRKPCVERPTGDRSHARREYRLEKAVQYPSRHDDDRRGIEPAWRQLYGHRLRQHWCCPVGRTVHAVRSMVDAGQAVSPRPPRAARVRPANPFPCSRGWCISAIASHARRRADPSHKRNVGIASRFGLTASARTRPGGGARADEHCMPSVTPATAAPAISAEFPRNADVSLTTLQARGPNLSA